MQIEIQFSIHMTI